MTCVKTLLSRRKYDYGPNYTEKKKLTTTFFLRKTLVQVGEAQSWTDEGIHKKIKRYV